MVIEELSISSLTKFPPDIQEYYVDTPAQLIELCERLRASRWLALDTEFMREKTYYAQFCLLQVATEDLVACVDPLALKDLGPLLELIYDRTIIKVMHSARQDLEMFYDLCGALPQPLFDTQIAATLLGYGDQVGYANLVQGMLGVELDKSHTRTDWAQRPLDPEQLRYAADDVRYLVHIYLQQCAELERKGRGAWLSDDFAELTDEQRYANSPLNAWRRIRQANTLKGVQLAVLRSLAAWREERAKAANKPRKWIVSDEALLELARWMPVDTGTLAKVRGVDAQVLNRSGAEIVTVIRTGKGLPKEQWPKLEAPLRLDARQEALADTLMAVVRMRGLENAVSPSILTTRKELEQLVLGQHDIAILHGWRGALVGHDLLALLQGKLSLRVRGGDLSITPVDTVAGEPISDRRNQSASESGLTPLNEHK
ncbi:MAG TPA: ribonuclease D [Gammaproteobacteria bacterium]|nr:ribonuclease D [Gammaproteobacteria bacterium]